ncbi:MAG TPA: ATP-binding cassette domain-containing protein [Gaiellaceae bacterium]
MALARVEHLSFAYPGAARPALRDVSLDLEPGETVALLGSSGSGKSTLLRALAALVPHFHGGRMQGRVEVAGLDTRRHRPAELAGTVASVFQDPEDQVVLQRVQAEVEFGLENAGTPPAEIGPLALAALASVGAAHLAERDVATLSGGELQRVCLASALALGPRLLLLDEPTSQLDPDAAEAFLDLALGRGIAVVCSEQRPARPLTRVDRVVFLEQGQIVLDAPHDEGLDWLAANRPDWVEGESLGPEPATVGEVVCRVDRVTYAYGAGPRVLDDVSLELRHGEVVALAGSNGSGKTTLGKLAAGLLEPGSGSVERRGRAAFLLQDPGRYLLRERADEEVAIAVGGDLERARRALAAVGLADRHDAHPRDLSSGERERLAFAAVAVCEPDLLVLDEPTRGVDPERKRELAALIRAAAPRRATLLITHDLHFAAETADRTVTLGRHRELVRV